MPIQPIHLGFLLLIAATAIPSIGNLGKFGDTLSEARKEADRLGADMVDLKLSQQEAEQKSEIANERYQKGCLPVVSDDQDYYVSLIELSPVVDPITQVPLPAGSVVCDAHGNTAVLVDLDGDPNTAAVASNFAFTGQKAVIDAHLSNYRGAVYTLPNN